MTAKNAKPARQSISKKIRFEVFKRDSFTCQYCGKAAPDAILQIEHIHPVSKGGKNDLLNLLTACSDCNSGKSDRLLDDNSVVAKQQAQLAALAERHEQLTMMLKWRDGLKTIEQTQVDIAEELFASLISGVSINDKGRSDLRKLIAKYGLQEILDCIELSIESYYSEESKETIEKAFRMIGGIAANRARNDSHLYYIRGIVRNRVSYCNEITCLNLLKEAHNAGANEDQLKEIATTSKNWTVWRNEMRWLIECLGGGE